MHEPESYEEYIYRTWEEERKWEEEEAAKAQADAEAAEEMRFEEEMKEIFQPFIKEMNLTNKDWSILFRCLKETLNRYKK